MNLHDIAHNIETYSAVKSIIQKWKEYDMTMTLLRGDHALKVSNFGLWTSGLWSS